MKGMHASEFLQIYLQGKKNFLYLNGKNVLQPKGLKTITDFLKEDKENYKNLRNNLSSYNNIFQYVFSNVFPDIYCCTERRGFNLKSNFKYLKRTRNKKQLEISLGKNPENYEAIRNETLFYEQKPIKVDDFNEIEEKEVKEWVEKQKRREVAGSNKLLKKNKKKQEESKEKEEKMWERLGELNKEFQDIKKFKKGSKKMSDSILKV